MAQVPTIEQAVVTPACEVGGRRSATLVRRSTTLLERELLYHIQDELTARANQFCDRAKVKALEGKYDEACRMDSEGQGMLLAAIYVGDQVMRLRDRSA